MSRFLGSSAATGDAPLRPDGPQGRDWVGEQLSSADTGWLDRLLRLLDRWWPSPGAAGSRSAQLIFDIGTVVVLILLVIGAVLLLRRVRLGRRRTDHEVLGDPALPASHWRKAAEDAIADGDGAAAVVYAFRALILDQDVRGTLRDRPEATASMLSRELAGRRPEYAGEVERAGRAFDEVHYGHRRAAVAQAAAILELTDRLDATRAPR